MLAAFLMPKSGCGSDLVQAPVRYHAESTNDFG